MKEVSVLIICLLLLFVVRGEDSTGKPVVRDGDQLLEIGRVLKGSNNDTLVRDAYRRYLGREPDQAGFKHWKKQLDSGKMSVFQMIRHIASSPEGKIKRENDMVYNKIRKAYLKYLERKPVDGDLKHWKKNLDGGMSVATMEHRLENSPEAKKLKPPCEAGFVPATKSGKIISSGECSFLSTITTAAECEKQAEANRMRFMKGYRPWSASGCVYYRGAYYFNSKPSGRRCDHSARCVCKDYIKCRQCPKGTYSEAAGAEECKPCELPYVTDEKRTKCINPVITMLETIKKDLEAQKEVQNDLSIKNSRLWQKEQVRLQHDKLMQQRKNYDNQNLQNHCKNELRFSGTVTFPAIEIQNEIEKNQDTTCIDTNRDELLKSFCSFTSDLDKLFQIQRINKEAKSFWPNICCKERNDNDITKTLESCDPPEGSNIKRENIIPFALSQGGNYNRHNLYVEVSDAIKKDGYLHEGMLNLLNSLTSIPSRKKQDAKDLVHSFFDDVSLCGPRIVNAPGNPENKLCELFVPYKHAMRKFYNLIESLFVTPIMPQSSFLETMERSLRKRSEATRLGKNNVQQMMQMKPKAADATCTGGSKWTSAELKQKKQDFCRGYNHLDLSDTNIKNVALHYLKHDISYNDKTIFDWSKQLRYEVTDSSCPAPLFTANDISIQQVAMDALGEKKEWVAVVNLNTQDKSGYLQSELPFCEDRKYLIGSNVQVKAYVDESGCCKHVKGYKECEELCGNKLKKLKDKRHKHYSKDVVLTGTQYMVADSHVSRRRRLLQRHKGGC
eukprot:g1356.t1